MGKRWQKYLFLKMFHACDTLEKHRRSLTILNTNSHTSVPVVICIHNLLAFITSHFYLDDSSFMQAFIIDVSVLIPSFGREGEFPRNL